jgi:iron complex outermembrane receptor protein
MMLEDGQLIVHLRFAAVERRRSTTNLILSVAACALLISGTLQAQESTRLEPIVVEGEGGANGETEGFVAKESRSATKTDTPLIKTPQSISVVTEEQIREQNPRSIGAALRYTAGVGAENTGARDTRYGGLEMRGFDVTDEAAFRDGLLLPFTAFANFGSLDPYGAERIDVIKGPASVLYGQGSPGGLYNYVSKRPTEEPLREVGVGVNSFGRAEGRFDFSDRITEDGAWRYRVTGLGYLGETEVDFVDDERIFIAPVIEYRPDADTSLTLYANYQRDRAGWGLQFMPYVGTVVDNNGRFIPRDRFLGEPEFDRFDTDQASLGYQFETKATEAITLRQNVRYAYLANEQEIVYGGGYADQAAGILNRYSNDGSSRLHSIAADNHAQAEFDTGMFSHTMITGLDYRWVGYTDRSDNYSAAPLDVFNPVYGTPVVFAGKGTDSRVRQMQTGLYLQDQIEIDRLSILLGGRYDWISTETENRLASTQADRSAQAFSGRAAIIYNFDNGIAPYLSYAESFQQPLDLSATGELFQPETGRQWEVGVKYQPLGFNGFFTAAVFDLVRDNVVRYDAVGGTFAATQTGQITSRGLELEGVVSLTDSLDLRAAYTYQDVRFTEDPAGGNEGNRPYTIPEHRAALWADYTFRSGALEGIKVGGGVRYVGSSFADDANTLKVPGYVVADAAIGYERDNYGVQVNVTNLFDKKYVASCFNSDFGCFYGEGRRITGQLTMRW